MCGLIQGWPRRTAQQRGVDVRDRVRAFVAAPSEDGVVPPVAGPVPARVHPQLAVVAGPAAVAVGEGHRVRGAVRDVADVVLRQSEVVATGRNTGKVAEALGKSVNLLNREAGRYQASRLYDTRNRGNLIRT